MRWHHRLPTAHPDMLRAMISTQAKRCVIRVGCTVGLGFLCQAPAAAQGATGSFVPAGGEWERYLRAQQIVGNVPLRMWTVRGFSDRELEPLSKSGNREWDERRTGKMRRRGALAWSAVPFESGVVFNSAFPFGMNDGALWAGRGVTVFGAGGVSARRGRFSVSLAPSLFVAQNAKFALAETGQSGRLAFANGAYPGVIDLPQRYGNKAYIRLDPGESTIRAEAGPVAFGFSSAAQVWGPAVEHAIILGNNAGGFPMAFLGSSGPVQVGPVRINGRIVWGRLKQSEYGPLPLGYRHFATGAVGSIGFRSAPGLELGATRFFHVEWPQDGILHAPFLAPLEGLLKNSLANSSNPSGNNQFDNQLATVFARWAIPRARLELYGEYGREDHSWDLRDLALEPDHAGAYLIGLQRGWSTTPSKVTVLRAELLNTRISHLTVGAPQVPFYVHTPMATGHTNQGQVLGSPGGLGGGGTTVALDRYTEQGRFTVRWDRTMRAEKFESFRKAIPQPFDADVMTSLRVERLRFTRHGEILVSGGGVLELNRDFGGDRFNLTSTISYRLRR